jgi:hypothetical protein
MLHRNMTHLSTNQRLVLEDLVGDLWHARRVGDLGRLASVCYVDVRRWAQLASRNGLAERAAKLILDRPHESREAFLGQVDSIVAELERILTDVAYERPPVLPPPKASLMLPLAIQP